MERKHRTLEKILGVNTDKVKYEIENETYDVLVHFMNGNTKILRDISCNNYYPDDCTYEFTSYDHTYVYGRNIIAGFEIIYKR